MFVSHSLKVQNRVLIFAVAFFTQSSRHLDSSLLIALPSLTTERGEEKCQEGYKWASLQRLGWTQKWFLTLLISMAVA